jgi:tetratricopeptide (TPR) repeat protein
LALERLGRQPEAIAAANRALAIRPMDYLYIARGEARGAAHDPRGALEDFERALALNPDNANALNNRAVIRLHFAQHHRDARLLELALADIRRALVLDPQRGLLHANLALVQEARGEVEAARSALREAWARLAGERLHPRFHALAARLGVGR